MRAASLKPESKSPNRWGSQREYPTCPRTILNSINSRNASLDKAHLESLPRERVPFSCMMEFRSGEANALLIDLGQTPKVLIKGVTKNGDSRTTSGPRCPPRRFRE